MLQWLKTYEGQGEHSMHDAASAAKLVAALRQAEPLTALDELSGWVDSVRSTPGQDEKVRSEILSLIQDAAEAHLAALFVQLVAHPIGKTESREARWKTVSGFLTGLTAALYASAKVLLTEGATGAPDAARCLHGYRMLAKGHLARYLNVPPKLWRLAYGIHDEAEKAGCAGTLIRLHASHKMTTSVTQELLRLLMLQSSAPEMMAPEQIEVADRVIDQLGGEFTLRAPGVADNPFCFDPSSDYPPHRAASQPPELDSAVRYFGAGTGFDTLQRLYKQMATSRTVEIRALGALGKDIAPHAQVSTLRHLLAFWAAASPYKSPERSPATGELKVVHGYAPVWQQLSNTRSVTTELTLAEDGDGTPASAETWIVRDTGGNELGTDLPQAASDWARCGNLVGVAMSGSDEHWVGMIRSMHAESGGRLHANIAILSRAPQTVQLRALIERGEEHAYSEQAAQQFAFNRVRAIILADGSAGSQKPNLLLPPESWKQGRVFEATLDGAVRHLRAVQALRRGYDYVRATFEWVEQA